VDNEFDDDGPLNRSLWFGFIIKPQLLTATYAFVVYLMGMDSHNCTIGYGLKGQKKSHWTIASEGKDLSL
jgi:hypothetical protein